MSTTTPAKQPSDHALKFEKWKTGGPLYTYRKQSGMTMGGVASTLGVSIGTIQNLEDGNRSPVGKFYFKKLCKLLESNAEAVAQTWERWLARKP
jgi:DNA-binding transcriptional regulator YiaG